jgi:hypothetical protein
MQGVDRRKYQQKEPFESVSNSVVTVNTCLRYSRNEDVPFLKSGLHRSISQFVDNQPNQIYQLR